MKHKKGRQARLERPRPHRFDTKVQLLRTPAVLFTKQVMEDMVQIVRSTNIEVGWLGSVSVTPDGDYLVEKIFLPEQDADSTTCELLPDGLARIFEDEMLLGGMEAVNKIRLWGHSHHTMGVSPSGQDERQFSTLQNDSDDFFIRLIMNKLGSLKVDVALIQEGILISDAPWDIESDDVSPSRDWGLEVKHRLRPLDIYRYNVPWMEGNNSHLNVGQHLNQIGNKQQRKVRGFGNEWLSTPRRVEFNEDEDGTQ